MDAFTDTAAVAALAAIALASLASIVPAFDFRTPLIAKNW